jgi:hypothetical protein
MADRVLKIGLLDQLGFCKVPSEMRASDPPKTSRIAALGLGLVLSVSCHTDEGRVEWWQAEQERIALSHLLELKEFQHSQTFGSTYHELQKIREIAEFDAISIRVLSERRSILQNEVQLLAVELAEFKKLAIQRQREQATGRTFEKLVLPSGRTFSNARVAAINDAGVTLRHAEGSARMRIDDLSPEQQVFFGLEVDLAIAAERREFESAVSYERAVDVQLAAMKVQEKLNAESAMREEAVRRAKRTQIAAQQTIASSIRPLSQPATRLGSRSWDPYSYRMQYPSDRFYYGYTYYSSPTYTRWCPSVYTSGYSTRGVSGYTSSTPSGRSTSFSTTNSPSNP